MGILEDIQRGWFGKRRDPRVKPSDDKSFTVPNDSHPANAHTVSPNANYRGVADETVEEGWARNDNYRSPDPTTHDAPQHHDQKEENNQFGKRVYTSAPPARMEKLGRAADPRWAGGLVSRPTGTQSSGRRIDPFDQGTNRRLNGNHFSMADMRREYPIGGMVPAAISRRNTYRLDPLPHDLGIVDMPNSGRFATRDTRIITEENQRPHGNSYRLG